MSYDCLFYCAKCGGLVLKSFNWKVLDTNISLKCPNCKQLIQIPQEVVPKLGQVEIKEKI